MKTKKEHPAGNQVQGNINTNFEGLSIEYQSKGTKSLPLCKKSYIYSQLKKKVLHTLNDAYSVTDIADKFDITYPQAYRIIREFCDDGKIIFTGSKRNRTNKRMTFHYQKISYYYKQNPGERERHRLLDMQKRYWRKTGEFISLQKLAQWKQSR